MIQLYVSPTGSDQNTGTLDAPVQTVHAARKLVRNHLSSFAQDQAEDIVVTLQPGIHFLNETLILGNEDAGTHQMKVRWEGSKDGKTTLTSGVPLQGWKPCEEGLQDVPEEIRGNIWFVDLPTGTEVNTLYGPDGSLPRAQGNAIQPLPSAPPQPGTLPARYGPDGSMNRLRNGETDQQIIQHDRFGFAEGALQPATDLKEAEFLIIPAMQWTMNILPVGEIDFDQNVVTLAKPCTYPIGIPHCAPEGSIWLENSLSVLSQGHWVYHAETSRLYLCSEDGNPGDQLIAGSLVEYIRLEGEAEPGVKHNPVKGIELRNLHFTHSNRYRFHGLTGKGIQHDWEMHDAPTCMVRLRHAESCVVEACSFSEGGSGGLRMDLACRNNRVENCEFSNLGGCGIVLCGYGLSRNYLSRDNQVISNHLHHLGRAYWHCPGIFVWQSGNNRIADNHVHDLPYTGIVCSGRSLYDRDGVAECSGLVDWDAVDEQCGEGFVYNIWHYSGLPSWWMREPLMHSRDNLIEYNQVHDVMQVMGDGDGIYISGAGGGNVVRFNVVGPCPSPTMSEGIRCDDDQHHTIIHGNLVYQLGGRATGITLKGINRITNNILALPQTIPIRGMLSLETGPLNGTVIQRNIFLTSAADQRFVNDLRIHGMGREARLRDTESNHNLFWCTGDVQAGERFLDEARSFSTDVDSCAEDPQFVDAENGDFKLKPDSPALSLGFQPLPLKRMLGKEPSA